MIYPSHLHEYLSAHGYNPASYYQEDYGRGPVLSKWDEAALGKQPTPDEVEAWAPTPPDPDLAPAPSLEIRDYKAIDAALDNATTVLQLKAVFRAYLRKRAGLL